MNRENYNKIQAIMNAVKELEIVDIDIHDSNREVRVTLTVHRDEDDNWNNTIIELWA